MDGFSPLPTDHDELIVKDPKDLFPESSLHRLLSMKKMKLSLLSPQILKRLLIYLEFFNFLMMDMQHAGGKWFCRRQEDTLVREKK